MSPHVKHFLPYFRRENYTGLRNIKHVGKCSPHRIKQAFHMLYVSYVTGEKWKGDFFLLLQSDNCCFTQTTVVVSAVWLRITTELTSK